jgi:hypothetical protein
MSSSCCWEGVVGAAGVDVIGADEGVLMGGDVVVVVVVVVMVVAGVVFCFVGVAVLESSSLSESESESQVRSSFVVCAAPIIGLFLAFSPHRSPGMSKGTEYTYP